MSTELSQLKMEREQILSNAIQTTPVVKLSQFASVLESESVSTKTDIRDEKILELNDKLLSTLEQADNQLQVLSQINKQLINDVQTVRQEKAQVQAQLQAELEAYKQREQTEKKARFESQLNKVHEKWCDAMSLTDGAEREKAKRLLSAFSEDKLAEVESQISHKLTQMQNVPQPITKQSDELASQRQFVESKPVVVKKQVHEMTAEERKEYSDYIHQQMVKTNYKPHIK